MFVVLPVVGHVVGAAPVTNLVGSLLSIALSAFEFSHILIAPVSSAFIFSHTVWHWHLEDITDEAASSFA